MKNKKLPKKVYFLLAMLILYLFLFFFNPELFFSSSKFFFDTIIKIIPILALVFLLMALVNYFITPQQILNFAGKKGIKKWFLMVFAGVLSTGPPYLWFPLLRDLKQKGLDFGLITTYLYSRAVVIAFIPLIIFYFSLKFTIVLSLVILTAALIQGVLMSYLIKIRFK